MSFSGQIKEELAQVISSPRHCQLAELRAYRRGWVTARAVGKSACDQKMLYITEKNI